MRSISLLRLLVVALAERRRDAAEREQLHQPRHGDLDQVDAGRFERLDEAAGQADARRSSCSRPCAAGRSGTGSGAARSAARPRGCASSVGARLVVAHDSWLQKTRPLPTRCCSGMRHCQPASCAIARVYGGLSVGRVASARPARCRSAASGSSPRNRPSASARSAGRESRCSRRTGRPRRLAGFEHQRLDEAALRMLLDAR